MNTQPKSKAHRTFAAFVATTCALAGVTACACATTSTQQKPLTEQQFVSTLNGVVQVRFKTAMGEFGGGRVGPLVEGHSDVGFYFTG